MTMNHPTTTAYLQGGSSGHILGYVDQVPVYLGYLLPKQDSGTFQITVYATQLSRWTTLYLKPCDSDGTIQILHSVPYPEEK